MPLTVRQALELPVLAAGDPVVLSGGVSGGAVPGGTVSGGTGSGGTGSDGGEAAGLDRPIRWAHVSEVRDVGALLVGGELVLTTGLGMAASPAAAAEFVDQLIAAGAAGLIVELSADYPSVPEPALRRARAAGLPLIVLNRKVRFVEVTEQVHRAIVAEQFEELQAAFDIHATFTELGLARAPMARLVEAAADLAGASVVLEDLGRRVLHPAAREEPVDRLLTDWERRSRLTPFLRTTGVGGPEGWLTTPVGIQDGAWGRLVLAGAGSVGARDEARARLVLERAAQALELGRMIDRDDTAIQLRVHGGFLRDLLDERLGSESAAAARLQSLGVPVEGGAGGYVAAVARLRAEAPADVDAAQRRMVRLSEQVHRALESAGAVALVGVLDSEHVGILLRVAAVPGSDLDADGLDAVARELRLLEDGSVLAAGQVVDRVLAAAGSLRSARVVADVAVAMPPLEGCARQGDIRLAGLLMSLREDARLQEFAEAELGALLEHEARHGSGLVDLLRHYLAVGGNKAELARVAHRNRTSLYPALRRLEELVGHPLDDPASRLSLGVALLAHDQGRTL